MPIKTIKEFDEKYKCGKCKEVFLGKIYQLCSCRFCEGCLAEYEKNKVEKCLTCKEVLNLNGKMEDKAHMKELDKIQVKCEDCDWHGVFKVYRNEHLGMHHVNCNFCNRTFKNKETLAKHNDEINGDCEQQKISCKLSSAGCKCKVSRKDLRKHLEECTEEHLKLMYNMIKDRIDESNSKKRKNLENNQTSANEDNKRIIHEIELISIRSDVRNYSNIGASKQEEVNKIKNGTAETSEVLIKLTNEAKNVDEKLHIIEKTINNGMTQSDNGKLIWKITNFKEKLKEMLSDPKNCIYSSPFYTSAFGYKVCGRINMNSDAKHLSVFIAIMKGNYDALQSWPFLGDITFQLLDQSIGDEKDHKTIEIKTPIKSKLFNSFMKPDNDKNIPFGVDYFCELKQLNSEKYNKDDTIFIKIVVKPSNDPLHY